MDRREIVKDNKDTNVKDTQVVLLDIEQQIKLQRRIVLKTERLVSALHLVTDIMDNRESLKWELRDTSLNSLKDLYFLSGTPRNHNPLISYKFLEKIDHITSLLEVGLTGGLISTMNHVILKDEYLKLKDIILKLKLTDSTDSFILAENFFGEDLSALSQNIPPILTSIKTEKAYPKDNYKGQEIFDSTVLGERDGKGAPLKRHAVIKDINNDSRTSDKSSRQSSILTVIKDSSEYTIKEIIGQVRATASGIDCSSKTIQRDLLFLVDKGILIKKGERRWSRYSRMTA